MPVSLLAARMTTERPDPQEMFGYRAGMVLADKYELVRPLAVGGMGVVWIARNRVLDVAVAVKVTYCSQENVAEVFTRRALSEARIAAQLAHAAVCRVIDFGVTDRGHPYVVSELLEGESLEEVLESRGPLPPSTAVQILLPVLEALSAAHAKGIVHRDVKPANIFLARDASGREQPKLLDFGIARLVSEALRNTATGSVVGTPCYMSPEQARGSRDVDFRSDVWSVCATLYELITGDPPFDAENYNAVMWAVLNTEPIPLGQYGVTDTALVAIVERGLRKEVDQRWSSADELAAALAAWLLDNGIESDICGRSLRELLLPRAARSNSSVPALSLPGRSSRPSVSPWRAGVSARLLSSLRNVHPLWMGGAVAAVTLALAAGAWVTQSRDSAPVADGRAPAAAEQPSKPLPPSTPEATTPTLPPAESVAIAAAAQPAGATGESPTPRPRTGNVPRPSAPLPSTPPPDKAPAVATSDTRTAGEPAAAAPVEAPRRAAEPRNAIGFDFGF
ncbi:MAG TPA: protein kinase [Polyangiaceae bacterium]|nr:protein kinase [Polyangiaceae bacterium]